MKKPNLQTRELMYLSGLFLISTLVALFLQHERFSFMLFLSLLMLAITFIAQFRQRRQVKTLHAKAKRKRTVPHR